MIDAVTIKAYNGTGNQGEEGHAVSWKNGDWNQNNSPYVDDIVAEYWEINEP